jgi:hypothetical protein
MNDILKNNLSFLEESRIDKVYTLMNEGFYLGIAMVLSNLDINNKKIKLLRNGRKEELKSSIQDLIGQEKLDAISSFAINKWEYGGDKQLANKYSILLDKKLKKEKK